MSQKGKSVKICSQLVLWYLGAAKTRDTITIDPGFVMILGSPRQPFCQNDILWAKIIHMDQCARRRVKMYIEYDCSNK